MVTLYIFTPQPLRLEGIVVAWTGGRAAWPAGLSGRRAGGLRPEPCERDNSS